MCPAAYVQHRIDNHGQTFSISEAGIIKGRGNFPIFIFVPKILTLRYIIFSRPLRIPETSLIKRIWETKIKKKSPTRTWDGTGVRPHSSPNQVIFLHLQILLC